MKYYVGLVLDNGDVLALGTSKTKSLDYLHYQTALLKRNFLRRTFREQRTQVMLPEYPSLGFSDEGYEPVIYVIRIHIIQLFHIVEINQGCQ